MEYTAIAVLLLGNLVAIIGFGLVLWFVAKRNEYTAEETLALLKAMQPKKRKRRASAKKVAPKKRKAIGPAPNPLASAVDQSN